MPEEKTITCPFCKEGQIKCFYWPRRLIVKYSKANSRKVPVKFVKEEEYKIISEKCPVCGKTKEELDVAFGHTEKSLSASEAAKRAQASGLPLKF